MPQHPSPDAPHVTVPEHAARASSKPAPEPFSELSFKEMCARFEVTPRTLRYYEYIELLAPRREGRTRFYGPRELARMTLILRGRRCGFSLEEIRRWLQMREEAGTEVQMRHFLGLADAQLETLAERRAQIEEVMAELRDLREVARRGMREGSHDGARDGRAAEAEHGRPRRGTGG